MNTFVKRLTRPSIHAYLVCFFFLSETATAALSPERASKMPTITQNTKIYGNIDRKTPLRIHNAKLEGKNSVDGFSASSKQCYPITNGFYAFTDSNYDQHQVTELYIQVLLAEFSEIKTQPDQMTVIRITNEFEGKSLLNLSNEVVLSNIIIDMSDRNPERSGINPIRLDGRVTFKNCYYIPPLTPNNDSQNGFSIARLDTGHTRNFSKQDKKSTAPAIETSGKFPTVKVPDRLYPNTYHHKLKVSQMTGTSPAIKNSQPTLVKNPLKPVKKWPTVASPSHLHLQENHQQMRQTMIEKKGVTQKIIRSTSLVRSESPAPLTNPSSPFITINSSAPSGEPAEFKEAIDETKKANEAQNSATTEQVIYKEQPWQKDYWQYNNESEQERRQRLNELFE